jgi:hypothetical protein
MVSCSSSYSPRSIKNILMFPSHLHLIVCALYHDGRRTAWTDHNPNDDGRGLRDLHSIFKRLAAPHLLVYRFGDSASRVRLSRRRLAGLLLGTPICQSVWLLRAPRASPRLSPAVTATCFGMAADGFDGRSLRRIPTLKRQCNRSVRPRSDVRPPPSLGSLSDPKQTVAKDASGRSLCMPERDPTR